MKLVFLLLIFANTIYNQTNKFDIKFVKASSLYADGHFLEAYDITKDLLNSSDLIGKKLLFKIQKLHGVTEFRIGKFELAKTSLKLALNILDTLKNIPKELHYADIYNNIGNIYSINSKFILAAKYINKAKSIYSKLNHIKTIHTMNNLGLVYEQTFRYQKAIEIYEDAIKRIHALLKPNHKFEASILNNLGIVYKLIGDYKKAARYHEKAIVIDKLTIGEKHPFIASDYNNLGACYNRLKQYKKAIQYYRLALEIRRLTLPENHDKIAIIYTNMGATYFEQKEYHKAIEYFKKDIKIKTSTLKQDNVDLMDSKVSLANAYSEISKYQEAEEIYKNTINQYKDKSSKNDQLVNIFLNFSKHYVKRNLLDSALKQTQKALFYLRPNFHEKNQTISSGSLDDYLLAEIFSEKGNIYLKLYHTTKEKRHLYSSLKAHETAVKLVEKIQRSYKNDESKLVLFSRFEHTYKNLVILNHEYYKLENNSDYLKTAYKYAQLSKSKVLNEKLRLQNIKLSNNSRLKKRYDELNAIKINLVQNELDILNTSEEQKKLEKSKEKFLLSEKYERLLKEIERDFPSYYKLKYGKSYLPFSKIQEKISKKLLIDYIVINNSIFTFTITKDEISLSKTDLPNNFDMIINNFLISIKKDKKNEFISLSQKLYQLLINPIKKKLLNKPLIIIPDNELFRLPFEALISETNVNSYKDLPYLIKTNEIIYYHSSLVFNKKNTNNYNNSFIGFAPAFTKKDINTLDSSEIKKNDIRSFNSSKNAFRPLPYSIKEIKDIKSIMKKNKIKTQNYLNENASKVAIKNITKNHKFIHLATHGYMDSEDPELSWLAFYGKKRNIQTLLYSKEIKNLNLKSDLIVLSSCESGTGKQYNSEGPLSLSTGFLYSGANHVLYSLWKVWERQTSELMINFYTDLFKNDSYSKSLQISKLKLLKNHATSKPIFWASFVLVK